MTSESQITTRYEDILIDNHSWEEITNYFTLPSIVGCIPVSQLNDYITELVILTKYTCNQLDDNLLVEEERAKSSARKLFSIIRYIRS